MPHNNLKNMGSPKAYRKALKSSTFWNGKIIRYVFLFVFSLFLSESIYSQDLIKLPTTDGGAYSDAYAYEMAVIKKALQITKQDYGDYSLTNHKKYLPRARLLLELEEGNLINVAPAPTTPEWETKAIPIYFPLRKGIQGYKIFLINKNKKSLFEKDLTLSSLKALSAGQAVSWSTGKRMYSQGFTIYRNSNLKELYDMLNFGRYDYFPRGIYEFEREIRNLNYSHENIVVENTKLLLLFQPVYIFVSPKHPYIAERLNTGIWKMYESGSFEELFKKSHDVEHYKKIIRERQIINSITDKDLSPHPELKDNNLWFYGWPIN